MFYFECILRCGHILSWSKRMNSGWIMSIAKIYNESKDSGWKEQSEHQGWKHCVEMKVVYVLQRIRGIAKE